MTPRLKNKEERRKNYESVITRFSVLMLAIPAMQKKLDELATKKRFDIRDAEALATVAKEATGKEAHATTYTGYNGERCYRIFVYTEGNESEVFDTQYTYKDKPVEAFRLIFDRFKNLQTWKEETEEKLVTLDERHAKASAILDQLNEYSDLIV